MEAARVQPGSLRMSKESRFSPLFPLPPIRTHCYCNLLSLLITHVHFHFHTILQLLFLLTLFALAAVSKAVIIGCVWKVKVDAVMLALCGLPFWSPEWHFVVFLTANLMAHACHSMLYCLNVTIIYKICKAASHSGSDVVIAGITNEVRTMGIFSFFTERSRPLLTIQRNAALIHFHFFYIQSMKIIRKIRFIRFYETPGS